MIVCTKCGHESEAAARFCSACATPLDRPSPEQRRIVTVLFCDMSGSTTLGERVDSEALRTLMLRYFAEMTTAIERHGGLVEKYIGDAVMAVFGVPIAREDDALRAVRAGAEMLRRFEVLDADARKRFGCPIAVRIGINTGEVVAGNSSDRQALVTGDAVNVAARLEQAAGPGEVLLGADTYRLVRWVAETEEVAPLALRGKSDRVPAWRLIQVGARPRHTAPRRSYGLIGRDRELSRLREGFARVAGDRCSQLVTLVGEPGVGKSRVVAEFAAALGDEAIVLSGRCLSYGDAITFWPIAEMVREAADLDDADSMSVSRARIEELIGRVTDGGRIAERVLQGTGLAGGEAPAEEINWAFRRLFERLAERKPLVLIVEDAHWAAPALLALLDEVRALSTGVPVLVLCVGRPELRDAKPEWTVWIAVEPLEAADIDSLITAVLGSGHLQASVRDRVVEAAAGNPLFAEELVAMLVEDGVVARHGGTWELKAPLGRLAIPPTLEALLSARLDRLAEGERSALERASIEGQLFHDGAVAYLLNDSRRLELRTSLEALSNKALINDAPANFTAETAFRFRHILIRDAAYGAVVKRARADLHQRYAEWLESKVGDHLPEYEEILAHHLEQAHRYALELGLLDGRTQALAERAAAFLAAAGSRAVARGDVPATVSLFERALRLMPPNSAARREVLPELATALMDLGRLTESAAIADQAILLSVHAGDRRSEWRARLHRTWLGQSAGDTLARGLQEAERARAVLAGLEDDVGLARAGRALGAIRVWSGEIEAAAVELRRALVHARRAGSRRQESEILYWLFVTYGFGPTPVEEGLLRIKELGADGFDFRQTEAFALHEQALLHAQLDHVEEARRLVDEGTALMLELGLERYVVVGAAQVFEVHLLADDLARAEAVVRDACNALTRMGDDGYLPFLAGCLADVLWMRGSLEEADEWARKAQRLTGKDDVDAQVRWRGVRAKLLARAGSAALAEHLAREAVDLASRTDAINMRAGALLDLGDVLSIGGRPDDAEQYVDAAIRLYEVKGNVAGARRARLRARAMRHL